MESNSGFPRGTLARFLSLDRVPRLIRWALSLAFALTVVLTFSRAATYLAFHQGKLPAAQSWGAFSLGWRFDLRVVASLLLPLLALGSLKILDPFRSATARRCWLGWLGVCAGVLVVFHAADFLHYQYLGQRLNATALGFLSDARISGEMVWQTYPVLRVTLGVAAAIAGAIWLFGRLHRWASAGAQPSRRRVRVSCFVVTLAACLVAIFGRLGQYPLRWSDAFDLRSEAAAHLALNPVQAFISSLSFRTAAFDRAAVRAHVPAMNSYLGVDAAEPDTPRWERRVVAPPQPAVRPPNIVVVICESFSGYKSSMWGNPLDATPFFAELCRQGVFFDNCFTPHIGTARGVWATITGVPDVVLVETASRNPSMVDQHTIINDFIGYEKLYFLGGSTSWANIRGLLANNIDGLRLHEEGSYKSPRVDVWGISDKNLFLEAEQVLRAEKKPFFAVIQTADNHRPYTIPKEDREEFKLVEVPVAELKRNGFESLAELNAFRYTDFAFRKFMEAARKSPYFDDTIFVFIGDHGIGGQAGPPFPAAWNDQQLTRYHVPLLFYAPRLLAPRRIHSVASMVDVLPTVAGLAKISYRNATLGRDLLEREARDGGRSNAAFVIDHHSKTIGVVRGQYFGQRQLDRPNAQLVWADFASAPASPVAPANTDHATLAQAFYETARYLLVHNKKPPRAEGSASHAR